MKLVELLAIPVGFAIVRSITKRVEAEPVVTPEPLIPEGLSVGPAGGTGFDIAPLFPTGKITVGLPGLGGGTLIPGGARSGGPSKPVGADVVIPFFPKGAGDPSLLKPVAGLAGLANLPKFGEIKPISFDLATLLAGMK